MLLERQSNGFFGLVLKIGTTGILLCNEFSSNCFIAKSNSILIFVIFGI